MTTIKVILARYFIKQNGDYKRVDIDISGSTDDGEKIILDVVAEDLPPSIDWQIPRTLYVVHQECDNPDTPPDFFRPIIHSLSGFKREYQDIDSNMLYSIIMVEQKTGNVIFSGPTPRYTAESFQRCIGW